MSTLMRAKLIVTSIHQYKGGDGAVSSESISMRAIAKDDGPYPPDGSDENNTFAKWTPTADFSIQITNPELFNQFFLGQKFYADFTPTD